MKKRFNRLLLCGLIVCSLAVPAGFADEENIGDPAPETPPPVTQAPATPEPATPVPITPEPETPEPATPVPITEEPSSEPTQEVTSKPSEKPTSEPTQEPTSEPTQEPTSEPTQEPTSEPTQEPTSEPTQEPTSEPTQEPTSEPTQEPTSEPTQEPTSEPTQEPTSEPTQEPTSEPTQGPSSEPSLEPSLEPTLEPTIEPSLEPSVSPSVSPEPSATPLPLPGEIGSLVSITPEGTAQQENGVWKIQLSAADSPISFIWTFDGEATSYLVYTQTGQDAAVFIAETSDMRIDLSSANYAQGQHMLYVGAVLADDSIAWGSIMFELASQQSGPPGGFPGGFPGGGRPSGGFPGGSASMGEMSQEEQGFRVTPGKALTSKHSSGTMNTAAYTCSEIIDSEEAIIALVLESTQTEIMLDSGAAFFASKDDGKLQLMPESDGACWHLNVLAMNTLAESGIDRVVFNVSGTAYSMSTRMEFSGSVYASLRAKGYVSKDVEISIDAFGVHVSVDGCSYSINDANELVPCKE